MILWQSYLISVSLRALGIEKFPRIKGGGGAPAVCIPFSFRIAIMNGIRLTLARVIPLFPKTGGKIIKPAPAFEKDN